MCIAVTTDFPLKFEGLYASDKTVKLRVEEHVIAVKLVDV